MMSVLVYEVSYYHSHLSYIFIFKNMMFSLTLQPRHDQVIAKSSDEFSNCSIKCLQLVLNVFNILQSLLLSLLSHFR